MIRRGIISGGAFGNGSGSGNPNATKVLFTNLQSNTSMVFNHTKNKEVVIQVYDMTGNQIYVGITQIVNQFTISVNNVSNGSIDGYVLYF